MNLRGIWARIGIRPWRLAALLAGFALALIVVLPFARNLLGLTCDAEEKAALVEVPQYGGKVAGKDLDIHGDEVYFFPNYFPLQEPPPGCALEFVARHALPKQVVEYYEKKLTEHGWKVTIKRYPTDGEGTVDYSVVGSRDGLRYVVNPIQRPGLKVTDIHVNVYRP